MSRFKPGDVVVYAKQKWSASPGPRATHVDPAATGEQYSYVVHKFWRVVECADDGRLTLATRRGKQYVVSEHDPLLRRPSLLERLLWRHKFPSEPEPGSH